MSTLIRGWLKKMLGVSSPLSDSNEILRRTFSTDSGMVAIWQPEQFHNVVNYDTWESELLEDADIARHIRQGALVPLNVGADGVYDCTIRVGNVTAPVSLSERETHFLLVSSEPHLFRSNGVLLISGLEHIDRSPGKASASVPLAAADWAATVHFIDWTQEPGAKASDGKPAPCALPDFVILLNPATPETQFRTKVNTFEEPESQRRPL